MGVLQRFERRLEGLVEGTFAKVFGGVVQPVEVAAALQREAEDRKAIVGQGRVLVPNDYVVELGPSDAERLREYDGPLRRELAAMVTEHAGERGWSFVGPVAVALEQVDDLGTGTFRVRSAVRPGEGAPASSAAAGAEPSPGVPEQGGAGARLQVLGSSGRSEREVALRDGRTRLGRSAEADVRLPDTGVSRLHAELDLEPDGSATITDLGSTNGTVVNGRRVRSAALQDGDRFELGPVRLVFRAQGA